MARIDVFVPTYCRPEWAAESVASVLSQTFSDLSVTVSDDSPTDVVKQAVASFSLDPRFKYVRHAPRLGMSGNWNDCLASASAEFVNIFHDDDVLEPTMFERAFEIFDRYPNVVLVHSSGTHVDEYGKTLGRASYDWPDIISGVGFRRRLVHDKAPTVVCASVIVRRRAFVLAGLFRERAGAGWDHEMWMRLAEHGDVAYINQPLIRNRVRTTTRASASLAWSIDTAEMLLELRRLEVVVGGDALWVRLLAEFRFLAARNLIPLQTVGFLLAQHHTALAHEAAMTLAAAMSPPGRTLLKTLLARPELAAAVLRKGRPVRSALRALREVTKSQTAKR